jgi:hypothetical protein
MYVFLSGVLTIFFFGVFDIDFCPEHGVFSEVNYFFLS